jgi:two-component system, response regulator / RNA-binding antiterminator
MSRQPRSPDEPTPSFIGQQALIVHRPHATVDAIVRQLTQLGITAACHWPELPEGLDVTLYGVVFFDADLGHDAQFPWPAGECPMPAIALIGSEAPGRVAWAIRRGADAHLPKPVGGGGIYSALLIAREAFGRRQGLRHEVAELEHRLAQREIVAAATASLMQAENLSAANAYRRLRRLAMAERLTIEEMAARLAGSGRSAKRRHDRA